MKPSSTRKIKYRLPQGYISWSQLSLVERSPLEYVEHYILRQGRFESEEMLFGRQFADAMENGEIQDQDEAFTFLVRVGVPRLDKPEMEISATYRGIKLLGKPDTIKDDLSEFREYKTGKAEWTQRRVDQHGQLVFYATIIFLMTNRIPKASLDWLKTYHDPETLDIKATGEVKSFPRTPFTLLDMAKMMERIRKAADKIDGLVRDYTKK